MSLTLQMPVIHSILENRKDLTNFSSLLIFSNQKNTTIPTSISDNDDWKAHDQFIIRLSL